MVLMGSLLGGEESPGEESCLWGVGSCHTNQWVVLIVGNRRSGESSWWGVVLDGSRLSGDFS